MLAVNWDLFEVVINVLLEKTSPFLGGTRMLSKAEAQFFFVNANRHNRTFRPLIASLRDSDSKDF